MTKYVTDLLFVAGLAMAAVGFWMFSPAAAFVIVGSVLMGLSLAVARKGRG